MHSFSILQRLQALFSISPHAALKTQKVNFLIINQKLCFTYHVALCVDAQHVIHAKDGEHVKLVKLCEMSDYSNLDGFYVFRQTEGNADV